MKNKILLAGDPVTDICVLRMKPRGGQDGQRANFSLWAKPGGVDLTHETLLKLGFKVHALRTNQDEQGLQALADLMCLAKEDGKEIEATPPPADKKEPLIARIKNYDGYAKTDEIPNVSLVPVATKETNDVSAKDCDIIYLNDAGDGLRQENAKVTAQLAEASSAKLLLHKMHHKLDFDAEEIKEPDSSTKRTISAILKTVQDHGKPG